MALRTAACLTLLVAEAGAQQCNGKAQAFCDGNCVWVGNGCQSANPSGQCAGRQQQFCSGDCQWNGSGCQQVCYHNNVAYSGDMQGQPITNEVNRENCKARCSRTMGCHYFTYYTNSRNCHLQDASASRQSQVGAVSGPESCSTVHWPPTTRPTTAAPWTTAAPPSNNNGNLQESMPPSVGAATAFGRVSAGNSFQNLAQRLQPGTMVAKVESMLPGWQLGGLLVAALASLFGAFGLLLRRSIARPLSSEEEQTQALAAPDSQE